MATPPPTQKRPQATKKSTRAQRGKSRRGCPQCKARRLKCDETHPECTNCIRRSLKCPGYSLQLRWSSKHERLQDKDDSPAVPAISNDSNLSEANLSPLQVDSHAFSAGFEGENSLRSSFSLKTLDSWFTSTDTATSDRTARGSSVPGINITDELLGPAFPSSPDFVDTTIQGLQDRYSGAYNSDGLLTAGLNNGLINLPTPWTSGQQPAEIWEEIVDSSSRYRLGKANSSDQRPSSNTALDPTIFQSLVDIPTTLIEYWFTHVCPIWSTFDSEYNFNRQMASISCTTSGAVFYTLQSMSAAHLTPNMPHLRSILPSLTSKAITSIKESVTQTKASQPPKVDSGLVFAMLGIGTTAHWTDPAIDRTWLDETSRILQLWKSNLPPWETFTHAYFDQAQVYWKMLMCAAATDFAHEKLDRRRSRYKSELQLAMQFARTDNNPLPQQTELPQAFEGTRPNSWCGVSSEVIDILGQVFSLCRAARERRDSRSSFSLATTCDVLCDIKVAYELQSELAAMDFDGAIFVDELLGFPIHTGDASTPTLHLVQTAEAYRLASLLQLYLTFDDLEIAPPGGLDLQSFDSCRQEDSWDSTSRTQRLLAVALQIVAILERIPAESGSRSIHPILYLSAASGLRFEQCPEREFEGCRETRKASLLDQVEAENTSPGLTLFPAAGGSSALNPFRATPSGRATIQSDSENHQRQPLPSIQRSSFEVAKARQFVQARMGSLRHILPPRPLEIVSDLIRKIWADYDRASFGKPANDSSGGSGSVHWLDIMMGSNLQTLFG